MIRTEALVYRYGREQSPVLNAINLCIEEGEYVAIIGPNGCGKTTLIRHFNALLLPTAGEVWIDGLNTRDFRSVGEIRRRVGMIFQNPDNQIVGMTVEEDTAFGPGNLGLPSTEIRQRVDEALATVGLKEYATRPPHHLSGGQKQLLALAGVLAMHPKYIVLDEPTSSLDPITREHVLLMLKQLHRKGITIIQVTHNMEEAAIADRLIVMNQGTVVADGPPSRVLSNINQLKLLGLAPPRITELMYYLQRMGEDVRTDIFTVTDAVTEITTLTNRLRQQAVVRPGGEVCRYV
ncbi:MAG: energy-coupling factor transporter ATPase [Syntrophomonadaceae bacterium]|nr:energy-coupling factor transporter ATPase [Syntrophomonadaceae bacterium]